MARMEASGAGAAAGEAVTGTVLQEEVATPRQRGSEP
jgi:hypothetical protein